MKTGQRIGFTGTRQARTVVQDTALIELLHELQPREFHHGACVGSDARAAEIVFGTIAYCTIHAHPGVSASGGANNDRDEIAMTSSGIIYRPLTHFARNRAIVAATDALVAVPCERWEPFPFGKLVPRGGTAYSVSYALKKGKPVWIVWPSGEVQMVPGVTPPARAEG